MGSVRMQKFYRTTLAMTENATLQLLELAVSNAQEAGFEAAIAIVDRSGTLQAFVRMQGAFLVSSELAQKKAITAVGMSAETIELDTLLESSAPRVRDGLTKTADFTVVGGGVPLYINEVLVGGVGVSGGSEEQDQYCAKAVADRCEKLSSL